MNIETIRSQFPILQTKVYGKDLVYLDNGATTQKPQSVIDNLVDYYTHYNSNVHRGVHFLSQKATDALEAARTSLADFINAQASEIIFTRGTTESINLVAFAYGEAYIKEGDEILISEMEHHSNWVPWYMLAERKKAILKFIPLNIDGELDVDTLDTLITDKTKLVAVTWVSNTLGTVNPVQEIIKKAHKKGAHVLVDGAQAVQHMKVDVQAVDADFFVASGHKMYAATGIGFLYIKQTLMNTLPPYQGGGSMIQSVSKSGVSYGLAPLRFEAGTPDIAGCINMGAAVAFINEIGIDVIAKYESELLSYTLASLQAVSGVRIVGNPKHRAGAISLAFDKAHPYDVGELLDKQGVAVRTGHHCCQPIMEYYGIPGTLRVSLAVYNNENDIQRFIQALQKALQML